VDEASVQSRNPGSCLNALEHKESSEEASIEYGGSSFRGSFKHYTIEDRINSYNKETEDKGINITIQGTEPTKIKMLTSDTGSPTKSIN
jgi:hypothetical protein